MDYDDLTLALEDERFDKAMEKDHKNGKHDLEPNEDCWVCIDENEARESH